MKSMLHNGIIIPKYEPRGFGIKFKGRIIKLNPEQEEMAVAWVRKLGTEYVQDETFAKNFFEDFCRELGIEKCSANDFDFSEIKDFVGKDRACKENMSKEEKKKLAAERKVAREANKEKYGYAIIDGERVELGNYMAEPSSIFMGRGKHPLRGKWKRGAKESDVTLNLSPDSKVPPGDWKIVWMPECMWIARWDDKLRSKEKYIWVSDTSPMKQEREMKKFEKARELEKNFKRIENHILKSLDSDDEKKRKVATVCFLIDAVNMRVGDEKDEDEADTVGATTLSKENILIKQEGIVNFNFLGKDSVKWDKDVKLPENVIRNLKEFIASSKDFVFDGVKSDDVNEFLSEMVEGITAKVFRTYHATKAVRDYIEGTDVKKTDPEAYKKYLATMANLQAAIVCNHKRKLPAKWDETLEKKKQRLEELREKENEKKTEKSKEAVRAMEMRIKLMKETKDYNLNTSLKSYVDPRIIYKWSKKVGFDWKKYYSKTLQRKFSWVDGKKCEVEQKD
jgi:DNA topoisomerase I